MPGRILIADALATNRILLTARLSAGSHVIVQAASGAEALASAAAQAPDLVILPARLPDMDGPSLCARLRAAKGTENVPVLAAAPDGARDMRLAALAAGADAVLPPHPAAGLLQARIRNLLRRRAGELELAGGDGAAAPGFAESPAPAFAPPGEIALIAGSEPEGAAWKAALAPLMRDRIALLQPGTALADLNPIAPPDAFVIAGGSRAALQLVADLRCRRETLRSSIILVRDGPGGEREALALDLGVSDVVETGFDAEEMALRLRREMSRKAALDRSRAALKDGLRMAATDALTGLFNRRHALRLLEGLATGPAAAGGKGFAVVMLDLDRFKQVNDRYGHAAGDAVLVEAARRMQRCLRGADMLARIGGEEFLAVIRDCGPAQARRAAERLRRAVGGRAFDLPGGGAIRVTLSAGLAMAVGGASAQTLIDRADRALYSAKAEGRDQVTLSQHAA